MIDLTRSKINDDGGWLEDAISSNSDNITVLSYMKPRLLSIYQNYDNLITQLNKPIEDSIFKDHVKTLNAFYSRAPKDLKEKLRSRRHDHFYNQCPFCGQPVEPVILDHFIPKNKWPEFSIFPNNLVSQCGNCSSKKSQHYYCDTTNFVKFIHPIYSNLLCKVEFKFIFSDVDVNNPENADISLTFKIKKRVSKKQRIRISLHLKHLEIKEYALKYARDKFKKRLREARLRKVYVPYLLNYTIKLYSKEIDNHWDVCIYKAMLAEQSFMSFFNTNRPES